MVPSERSTASEGSVAFVWAGGETLVVKVLAARALWPATRMNPTARERERVGLLMSSSVTLGRPRPGRRFHPGPLHTMCNTGSHGMSPSQHRRYQIATGPIFIGLAARLAFEKRWERLRI